MPISFVTTSLTLKSKSSRTSWSSDPQIRRTRPSIGALTVPQQPPRAPHHRLTAPIEPPRSCPSLASPLHDPIYGGFCLGQSASTYYTHSPVSADLLHLPLSHLLTHNDLATIYNAISPH